MTKPGRYGMTVHPRACGEHYPQPLSDVFGTGSSPRMRGAPNKANIMRNYPRFIPAHAGSTKRTRRRRWKMPVHPRACGEHRDTAALSARSAGSSPRMRGAPPASRIRLYRLRFIPAHAGSTQVHRCRSGFGAVHPRACGEHTLRKGLYKGYSGSSPRMRGALVILVFVVSFLRFIPAHAGSTQSPRRRCRIGTVHPRACGEHIFGSAGVGAPDGSSPRMRGAQLYTFGELARERFIPAHAGSTRRLRFSPVPCAVHPRACGEHQSRLFCLSSQGGSSPRMRGARHAILA